jgi:hypothetical protein
MTGLLAGHRAQLEARASAALVHQLGQRVRQTAGADVVDRRDGAVLSEREAAVDDLLTAPLHLGVVPLHRGKIELGVARALRHRGGRAAAEADAHRGARRARPPARRPRCAPCSRASGAPRRCPRRSGSACGSPARRPRPRARASGRSQHAGPPELVAIRRGADGRLQHDVERRGDALGSRLGALPRPRETGHAQVRDGEPDEARLGLRAAARRPLVADLAARARGRARVGEIAVGWLCVSTLMQTCDRSGWWP